MEKHPERDACRSLPDFLGIGAQKAGTSWLFEQLCNHPDVWMPAVKEIHYFDQYLDDGEPATLRGLKWRLSRLERDRWARLPRKLAGNLRRREFAELGWNLKYHFRPRSANWYRSLFRPYRARLVGEITPEYGILDSGSVRVVKAITPDAKIIFLMRDPVDRAWSQVRMRLGRFEGRDLNNVPAPRIREFMMSEPVLRRSRYMQTLKTWGKFYSQDNVFVGFMEDISDQPTAFLKRVQRFLEIESSERVIPAGHARRVHTGVRVDMPEDIGRDFAIAMLDDLKELNRQFGGHTTAWLKRAERLAAG